MAREGYKEAKRAIEKARERLRECIIKLDEVEVSGWSDQLKALHRSDWQREIASAKAELLAAEETLAALDVKAPKIERKYFTTEMKVHLSLTDGMYAFLNNQRTQNSISFAEVIRRALTVYEASTKEVLK